MAAENEETKTEMEKLLGSSLLTPVSKAKAKRGAFIKKPTKEVLSLADKDFVLLYFSAGWCGPCQEFTPKLIEFYNQHAKSGRFEVVFVSSDKTESEFNEYYGKMPWTAMADEEIKESVSKRLRVRGIPTLALLQNKSGFFVTAKAADPIKELTKLESGEKLITQWKTMKGLPIEEGSSKEQRVTMMGYFLEALRNGAIIFVLLNLYNVAVPFIRKLLSGSGSGVGHSEF